MEIVEAVNRQLQDEIGESTLNKEQHKMLQQKYGLMAPQFTASERNLILREERKNGANGNATSGAASTRNRSRR